MDDFFADLSARYGDAFAQLDGELGVVDDTRRLESADRVAQYQLEQEELERAQLERELDEYAAREADRAAAEDDA